MSYNCNVTNESQRYRKSQSFKKKVFINSLFGKNPKNYSKFGISISNGNTVLNPLSTLPHYDRLQCAPSNDVLSSYIDN